MRGRHRFWPFSEGGGSAVWHCRGCDQGYPSSDADMITDHVKDCDYVDGGGGPIMVAVEWTEVHRYTGVVPAERLAAATGGIPFAGVMGRIDDDEPERMILGDLLATLDRTEADVSDMRVTAVYDAAGPRPGG